MMLDYQIEAARRRVGFTDESLKTERMAFAFGFSNKELLRRATRDADDAIAYLTRLERRLLDHAASPSREAAHEGLSRGGEG